MIQTAEDDEFARIEHENEMKSGQPYVFTYVSPSQRNVVLEEVALEFDKMTSLGDTAASFAVFVRNMKK
jgi:hypothetical protein